MEPSSLLQCSATVVSQSLFHISTKISSCSLKPKIPKHTIKNTTRIPATTVPARDRVIDFGRHKGKMLGTLPSSYLKWVSNNLRARDFEEWAKLADQVLNDPIYRDRIEWEFAEKILNGDVSSISSRSDGAVSELLEISQRFGWDNEEKVGWSKIDIVLLGTSKGGRIPRKLSENEGVESELKLKREKVNVIDGEEARGTREMRRERLRLKRGGSGLETAEKNGNGGFRVEDDDDDDDDQVMFARNQYQTMENRSPFPGRESLLKKVLITYRKRLS